VEERTDYEALAARYDEDRARWSFPPDDVVAGLLASPALGTALRVVDLGCWSVGGLEALADAERRVVSQLALLDDGAYERGLARLQEVAADPHASVTTTRSRLQLTAYRSERAST
jgi:hypothetical protein